MNVSSATMVERDEMNQILREQDFQQTGCVSSECMVEVGQLVGVTQIIGGSISKVGNTFSVNARIIEVETGEIVNSVNYDITGVIDELLISGMRNVSQLLFAGSEGDYLELGKDYEYYESGQLEAEGRSISSVKLGRWIYYYENGRIQKVGSYKDGKEIGKWTYYNDNGSVMKVGNYSDGLMNGQCTYYYGNGSIQKVGDYIDGIMNGEWTYYFENSNVKKVGEYREGIRNGKWTCYDENAEIMTIAEIIPSQSILGKLFIRSKITEYYKNGNLKTLAILKNGFVHGPRTSHAIGGEVLGEEIFNRGEGKYIDYYENGQKKEQGYCVSYNGIEMTKVSVWVIFNELSDTTSVILYHNDGSIDRILYNNDGLEKGTNVFNIPEKKDKKKNNGNQQVIYRERRW